MAKIASQSIVLCLKIKYIMRNLSSLRRILSLVAVLFISCCATVTGAQNAPAAQNGSDAQVKILTPEDLARIMPGVVFFRGQSASVQMRNAYGVRFSDGTLLMAALVDASGYSSGIKQKYQGYLLSEHDITVNGRTLVAGAYGFGFIANNRFIVMDIGAHDLLNVADQTDAGMRRPRPLSIEAGQHPGSYRLYEGRKFISLRLK